MSSEQQIHEPNQIQLIVGALIQANQIAQQITDENIQTVLLNTNHHSVSLINVLNKQFEILFKRISESEEMLQRSVQQAIHDPPIRMPILEENPGTYDNIYEIISQFLKITPQQLKESIHRSLIVEDPEEDSKLTLKLEKGKVNKLIQILFMKNIKSDFLYLMGKPVEENLWEPKKIIHLEFIKLKINILYLQKREEIFKSKKEKNVREGRQNIFQKPPLEFRNTNPQYIQGIIKHKVEKALQFRSQQDRKEGIREMFCEQFGSGPYLSAQSYSTHIHYKHLGKTPNKNKLGNNLKPDKNYE